MSYVFLHALVYKNKALEMNNILKNLLEGIFFSK
jgi:hypothetical protein